MDLESFLDHSWINLQILNQSWIILSSFLHADVVRRHTPDQRIARADSVGALPPHCDSISRSERAGLTGPSGFPRPAATGPAAASRRRLPCVSDATAWNATGANTRPRSVAASTPPN